MPDTLRIKSDTLRLKDCWVFDLDNTLYPYSSNLFAQIDVKMTAFIMNATGFGHTESRALQKKYLLENGTTLFGLMEHYNVDPRAFMDDVHNIDYTPLTQCMTLTKALEDMPVKKYVFTNGTKKHAENALKQLGMLDLFDGLFGVEDCDFVPKPQSKAYDVFIDTFKINPNKAVFVEDTVRNLAVPKQIGFSTIYVKTDCEFASTGAGADFIDYECEDIGVFLTDLNAK